MPRSTSSTVRHPCVCGHAESMHVKGISGDNARYHCENPFCRCQHFYTSVVVAKIRQPEVFAQKHSGDETADIFKNLVGGMQ